MDEFDDIEDEEMPQVPIPNPKLKTADDLSQSTLSLEDLNGKSASRSIEYFSGVESVSNRELELI